jgi:hypothetical protein
MRFSRIESSFAALKSDQELSGGKEPKIPPRCKPGNGKSCRAEDCGATLKPTQRRSLPFLAKRSGIRNVTAADSGKTSFSNQPRDHMEEKLTIALKG